MSFATSVVETPIYNGVISRFAPIITAVVSTTEVSSPIIAPDIFLLYLYTSAALQEKTALEMTFISMPQGPVVLTVTISIRDVTTDIISPDTGPRSIAPMAITASFGLKDRNWTFMGETRTHTYASAVNSARVHIFLIFFAELFIVGVPFPGDGRHKKIPAKAGNDKCTVYLFSSGLYRRCRNFTCSIPHAGFADYTAGMEFHHSPKINILNFSAGTRSVPAILFLRLQITQ